MKKLVLTFLFLPLTIFAQPDFAKTQSDFANSLRFMEGTLEITPSDITAGGKLIGCQIEYGAMVFDHVYSQGAPYLIKGSIGLNGVNDNTNIAVGLKIGTNRLVSNAEGKMTLIPEKPFLAYLKAPSGATNVSGYLDKTESDNLPGGMFYIYQLENKALAIIEQMMDKKSVSIMFNRRDGGYDVAVPIDLTVESVNNKGLRTKSDKAITAFSACFSNLLGVVSDNIKKQNVK